MLAAVSKLAEWWTVVMWMWVAWGEDEGRREKRELFRRTRSEGEGFFVYSLLP